MKPQNKLNLVYCLSAGLLLLADGAAAQSNASVADDVDNFVNLHLIKARLANDYPDLTDEDIDRLTPFFMYRQSDLASAVDQEVNWALNPAEEASRLSGRD